VKMNVSAGASGASDLTAKSVTY